MKATTLRSLALGVGLLGAVPAAARADVITINFDGLAPQTGLSSLTFNFSGITAVLTREGGALFDLSDISAFAGAPFTGSSLSPESDVTGSAFILNFSQAITSLSMVMGDFGADDDLLSLQLFSGSNASGSVVGSASGSLPANGFNFSFATVSASDGGARSARFIGGSAEFPNSVLYDNITATYNTSSVPTAAPEPGTIILMASGLFGVGLLRRRKRA